MNKKNKYLASIREIAIRLEKGGDLAADLGNMLAVLQKRFDYFWIGLYLLKDNHLVLGPFQGPPACVFLTLDAGICAVCVREKQSIIVPDVHTFPGHIACDPASKSEIVVPLFNSSEELVAVLDVDSVLPDFFDEVDREYLEKIGSIFQTYWGKDRRS